jgi:hypothetical protein
LDASRRSVYAWTLLVGFAIGTPLLIYSSQLRALASAQALVRLGLFSPAGPQLVSQVPRMSVVVLALSTIWIWRARKPEIIYLWSLLVAGILLSHSSMITGVFLHEYHWDWFSWPVQFILFLVVIAEAVEGKIAQSRSLIWPGFAFLSIYFASAIYLLAYDIESGTSDVSRMIGRYEKYQIQRLAPGTNALVPRSTVAGDEEFCELAQINENEQALSGPYLPVSMALDDDGWRLRLALNAYLSGTGRGAFRSEATRAIEGYWNLTKINPETVESFMQTYDEIVRDPHRFIRSYAIRYVVLPVSQQPLPYLAEGWWMIQSGPYWNIWERKELEKSSSHNP